MTRNFVRAATTIAAILLAACGGKGKKSVSEDGVPVIYKEDIQMMPADSVIDLSRYTESWDTVFLEATDQSLVGNIDKVFCYDGLLFVGSQYSYDDYVIMVFDYSGHYLNRIGFKGRARQEYLGVGCWTVDSVRKEVLIYDYASHRVLYYDYAGKYLRDMRMPEELPICSFISINALQDNSVLLHCLMSLGNEINYGNNLIAIHPDGTYRMLLPESDVTGISATEPNIHNEFTNGELWTTPVFSNRVYRITDNLNVDCMLEASYVKMPHNISPDGDAEYNCLEASFNTKDFLFHIYFNLDYRTFHPLFMIEKSTLKCYNPDVRYGKSTFGLYLSFAKAKGCSNEVMVFSLTPEIAGWYIEDPDYEFENMTPQEQAFCRKVSGLENPVLLLYHINKEHFLPSGSTAENSGKSPFKMPLQPNKLLPSP